MAGIQLIPDTPETAKALNDAARHEFIVKMYADIMKDMVICELEGWDKMEYINMLYDVLNHFKQTKEASDNEKRESEGQAGLSAVCAGDSDSQLDNS